MTARHDDRPLLRELSLFINIVVVIVAVFMVGVAIIEHDTFHLVFGFGVLNFIGLTQLIRGQR
ncbi:MAG: hypothetical protein ACRDQA_07510 [Nocardioidaceae bacterium]